MGPGGKKKHFFPPSTPRPIESLVRIELIQNDSCVFGGVETRATKKVKEKNLEQKLDKKANEREKEE